MEGRNRNIDGLKGFLIVMVILGHILQGKVLDNFGRYVIYSFHMPLFVGLSGYLLNIDSIRSLSIGQFFGKYGLRVLLPWAVASHLFRGFCNPSYVVVEGLDELHFESLLSFVVCGGLYFLEFYFLDVAAFWL